MQQCTWFIQPNLNSKKDAKLFCGRKMLQHLFSTHIPRAPAEPSNPFVRCALGGVGVNGLCRMPFCSWPKCRVVPCRAIHTLLAG